MYPWIRVAFLAFVLMIGGVAMAAEKIDINTASQAQLETLPGIGPVIAGRIIEYRQKKPFASIEEIKEVKGIGEATFLKIQDMLTVSAPQAEAKPAAPADAKQ
jgi:competence protein ComEA